MSSWKAEMELPNRPSSRRPRRRPSEARYGVRQSSQRSGSDDPRLPTSSSSSSSSSSLHDELGFRCRALTQRCRHDACAKARLPLHSHGWHRRSAVSPDSSKEDLADHEGEEEEGGADLTVATAASLFHGCMSVEGRRVVIVMAERCSSSAHEASSDSLHSSVGA